MSDFRDHLDDLLRAPAFKREWDALRGAAPKIYLETTAFNWYFEIDRAERVNVVALFDAIRGGLFQTYTSEFAVSELRAAPEPRRSMMLELASLPMVATLGRSQEAEELREAYIREGVIPSNYQMDAVQVAVATINSIEHIVTYNLKHLNNDRSKRLINEVNLSMGYSDINICTAKEVLRYVVR